MPLSAGAIKSSWTSPAFLSHGNIGTLVGYDSESNIYCLGQTGGQTKFNKYGRYVWTRSLSLQSGTVQPMSGAVTSVGKSFCGGSIQTGDSMLGNYTTNGFLVQYDSQGTLVWQKYLYDSNTLYKQYDVINKVYADSVGNIYITGTFYNSSLGTNAFIIKLNSNGAITWQRSLADSNTAVNQNTVGKDIVVDSTGNVYVVGSFKNTAGGQNGFIAKYNSSGTFQWARRFYNANLTDVNQFDSLSSICLSSDVPYVAGSSSAGSPTYASRAALASYDVNGNLLWQKLFLDSTNSPNAAFLSLSSDTSGIYASGYRGLPPSGGSALYSYFIKCDTAGNMLWERSIFGNDTMYGSQIFADSTTGYFYLLSGEYAGGPLLCKLPRDGTKTGVYKINYFDQFTYSSVSLSISAGNLTSTSVTQLTSATPSLTIANSNLVDSEGIMDYANYSIK